MVEKRKDTRKGDRHKDKKKDRHRPGYIRPSRRKKVTDIQNNGDSMTTGETNKRGRPRKSDEVSGHLYGESGFTSWEDFLQRTTETERLYWYKDKASTANNIRRHGRPKILITGEDVWNVLESYRGICRYCGSLALERKPTREDGKAAPWRDIGKRIGSLDHIKRRIFHGDNTAENLAWCCYYCNTDQNVRNKNSIERLGALYPYPISRHPVWTRVKNGWVYAIDKLIIGAIIVTPKKETPDNTTKYHYIVDNEIIETWDTRTGKIYVEAYYHEIFDIRYLINNEYGTIFDLDLDLNQIVLVKNRIVIVT